MKKYLNLFVISAMLFCALSCTEKQSGGGGETPNVGKNVTVKFTPERTKVFKNPFSGWAIYAGLGSGLPMTFWDLYDNYPSKVGNIKLSDYASLLLVRMKWAELEPERGLYAWDPSCNTPEAQRYRMLIEGARQRGLKVVISMRNDSRDLDVWAVPKYLRDELGCQGFTSGGKNVWTPYPDDPVFQREYAKFLKALATQLDDPSIGAYVQGLGIGLWGEYHTCIYSTGTEAPRQAVLEWLCDAFMDAFQNIPVVINYHRLVGSTKGSGSADPQSAALLDIAYQKGLCFGSGAFGMKSYYSTWERNFIAGYKYKVPVTMEGGWVRGSHSMAAINGDGYATWADVRKGEYLEAAGAFANVMDLRYNSDYKISETWSWLNEAWDLFQGFITDGMYRLYPSKISYPDVIANGAKFSIQSTWNNLGWSYCPTNVVQYKKRYKVAYALLDGAGNPAKLFYHNEADPSKWYKDQPVNYTYENTMSGVPAGKYTLAVAIVDVIKENTPGILLSVKNTQKIAGEWVKIGEVEVR